MAEAYFPTSIAQAEQILQDILPRIHRDNIPFQVLGWGSNTLISSNGLRGITLILRKLASIEQLDECTFRFGAGVHLAKVSHATYQAGLHGGEFFVGIPGTMGGAACMNAGAMGHETSMVLQRVLAFDLQTGQSGWLEKEQLRFNYRFSDINPHRHIVLATECRFSQGDKESAKQLMDINVAFRKEHHPTEPNGGSVFRNPSNAPPVGKMVDDMGGKGVWHVGDAWVSPKHGNFIINKGCATSLDVLQLMCRIKQAVLDTYGVTLFPENRFIGDASAEEHQCWQWLKAGDSHHGS
jgi:UDP-N-acetylmuramate dehydrogenase